MDGVLDNSRTAGGNYAGTGAFCIGQAPEIGGTFFDGNIDEVIVAKTVRTAKWLKLCYQNQQANQTLVSVEDYSTWGYSNNITMNTSSLGLSGNVLNFPYLVRLTSANFQFDQRSRPARMSGLPRQTARIFPIR